MNSRQRPSLNLELLPSDVPGTVAHHAARWGLLLALALLTFWLFPIASGPETPMLNTGDVSPTEVIAPFAFPVRKAQSEMDRESAALEATVRPIYEYRADVIDSVLQLADTLFAQLANASGPDPAIAAAQTVGVRLSTEDAQYLLEGDRLGRVRVALRRLLQRELRRGVAASGPVERDQHREFLVRRNGSEGVARRDTVRTERSIIEGRFSSHPDPNSATGDAVFTKLIAGLFRPTLVPNQAEYEQLRLDLRGSVNPIKDSVQVNERIIDANEVVTDEVHDRLMALRQEVFDRGL
ncbi:MAG: hypothetical protein OER90_05325, partial [Gemmatimonadota bacterium]|nr:hypothetical protein [Gemmatimonadota bacterium]